MRLPLKPGKTFYHNLFTLCVVFLLTGLLLIPVYSLALNGAYERSVSTIQYGLDAAAQQLDDEALELLSLNDQLTDPAIYQIKHSSDMDTSPMISYKLLKCKSMFKLLTNTSNTAFEYLWLFTNNSRVITSGETDAIYNSYVDSFDSYLRFIGNSAQLMRENLMHTSRQLTLLPANELMLNGVSQGQCITLVAHPLNCASVYCALYRLSDIETLFGLDILPDTAYLTYTDHGGSVIFCTENEDIKNETVLSARMPVLDGTVSIHLPESYFSSQVASVKRLLITYLLIAAAIGIMLAVLIAIFNYRPLYNLIRSSSDENPYATNDKAMLDEYAFLNELNIRSKNKQQEMLQQINSMRQSIRSVHLERLLMSTLSPTQEQTIVQKYLPELVDACRLAIIDIGYDRSEAEAEDIILTMLPVFEQHELHMTYMGYGQIYTLFPDGRLMKFEEAFNETNEAIRKSFNTKACATISAVFTGTEGLRQAFRSVQITAITSIHSLAYVQENGKGPDELPFVDLNALCQLIHSGSSSAAEHFIINALNELLESGACYDDMVRLYDTLRSKLITFAGELNAEVEIAGFIANMPILEQFETLGMAASMLSDKQDRKKVVPAYKNEMLEFIDNNYADANMYAGSIAEQFQVSTKQVYRVVRELTGTGFSDYLEELRIRQAVKLLDETDVSVNDVAIKCGFNSVSTFYRAFKRVHGISPTAYRTRTN